MGQQESGERAGLVQQVSEQGLGEWVLALVASAQVWVVLVLVSFRSLSRCSWH